MKSTHALSLLAGTSAVAADFVLSNVYTKQPNGNPDGQTNNYIFEAQVTSTDGGPGQNSAYCWSSWPDNSPLSYNAYSDYAPLGWVQCAHNSSDLQDKTSNFAFQLQAPFAIGDFSVTLQQNYTVSRYVRSRSASFRVDGPCRPCPIHLQLLKACEEHGIARLTGMKALQTSSSYKEKTTTGVTDTDASFKYGYHITNTTSAFTCSIIPSENPSAQVHASGECTTPTNSTGFTIPATTTVQPNTTTTHSNSSTVTLNFAVQEKTVYGDNVFVAGNISQLGNWNPYDALPLSAIDYTDINTLWDDGNLTVAPGTAFEYKFIQWGVGGVLLWECYENRVYVTPSDGSSAALVGNNPDYFRCGNH
ncbi:hypothetical protein LTR91_003924 [Friedmanniomyces endolithicus]|uniref:CBM20 domain-containing protein n=1 Tax=Friedmanniomyces endolithicus TaxID=329885 RepID=A0AAN6KW17_9PEZI|nr:hypothetical protein LTS00_016261 [Friedmanniomyces endolithicus]KAK0829428.1 hypothetical protein LTR73_004372 [Friedmanniomyces endolithicus]KAK0956591.1 hypothetical protein LTS01_022768 [Friedmanniomyces endolithicus]KAK1005503.1 hypothetical protein LTR91_003924 [Friedmanniomyces endolithicus]